MANTRTYEDFAGMLGRRVRNIGRMQPGGKAGGFKQAVEDEMRRREENGEDTHLPDTLRMPIRVPIGSTAVPEPWPIDSVGTRRPVVPLPYKPRRIIGIGPNGEYIFEPDTNRVVLPLPLPVEPINPKLFGCGGVSSKRKGGNIMNYTVYFKDGGLLPKSQRRVYQTGGKASAQDTMQQLYQLTQVAMNGSGQEQQQAMQALGQFVGEAMNGNQQYAQIIQAVFDGAKKGSREMTQMAQVFQSIMQQMQKREFGGRLDYITMLRNGGRPRYQTGG